MLVSIIHRVTGTGLAVGALVLVWWLVAASGTPDAYGRFSAWAGWKWALLFWIPLTWALIQHALSGLRHFVLDTGAGYEIEGNKRWALATLVLSVLLTAALWAWIIYGRTGA